MTISADVPLHQLPRSPLEASFATGNDGADGASAAGQRAGMVRSCLVAEEGDVTVTVDFDRMELVLAAALSGDSTMRARWKAATCTPPRRDSSSPRPTPTPEQRSRAKTLNFALMYGAGADSVSRMIGVDRSEAEALIARWWGAFPALRDLRDTVAETAGPHHLLGPPPPRTPGKEHATAQSPHPGVGQGCVLPRTARSRGRGPRPASRPRTPRRVRPATAPATEAEEVAREVAQLVQCQVNYLTLEASHAVGGRSWGSVKK